MKILNKLILNLKNNFQESFSKHKKLITNYKTIHQHLTKVRKRKGFSSDRSDGTFVSIYGY